MRVLRFRVSRRPINAVVRPRVDLLYCDHSGTVTDFKIEPDQQSHTEQLAFSRVRDDFQFALSTEPINEAAIPLHGYNGTVGKRRFYCA